MTVGYYLQPKRKPLGGQWPSFASNELGNTVKKVVTPDMNLHIYATAADETVHSIARKKKVNEEKLMELTIYFNSSIKTIASSSVFSAHTVLVIDMEVREKNEKKKRKTC